ncbi:MAG: hypothetical protein A3F88_03460 [Deltaproteobacteria bacterium RIFCSPLOWO2_12_FULL_42_16]|nr:MAG: hypothetical protein A3F88_03460 [Deltaproteobacteria bacterium RIFCSPLOWO2_12_FULL_42_16]
MAIWFRVKGMVSYNMGVVPRPPLPPSHILTDIERFCDRVGIIVGGKLRSVDRLDNLLLGTATLENIFLNEVEKAGGGIEI